MKTGGETSCVEIRTGETLIVMDAGTGIRELGNRLLREKNRHIHLIMTHAHWDHVIGFPFFRPLTRRGRWSSPGSSRSAWIIRVPMRIA